MTGPIPSEEAVTPSGTQLLDRAVAVIRHLAAAGEAGDRLGGIAEALGLNLSTAHRILGALERHSLVEREGATRSYRLGVALFALGAQAADGAGMRRLCRTALLRISAETQETVFLMVRSSLDAVCVDRVEGTYMIETLTRHVGGQIPLGVGSAGVSILAFLPGAEADVVLKANAERYQQFGLSSEQIRSLLPEIQQNGYAVTWNWMIDGVSAVAMPIRPAGREVTAAIAINLTTARLTPDRLTTLVRLLQHEVTAIEGDARAGAAGIVNSRGNP